MGFELMQLFKNANLYFFFIFLCMLEKKKNKGLCEALLTLLYRGIGKEFSPILKKSLIEVFFGFFVAASVGDGAEIADFFSRVGMEGERGVHDIGEEYAEKRFEVFDFVDAHYLFRAPFYGHIIAV